MTFGSSGSTTFGTLTTSDFCTAASSSSIQCTTAYTGSGNVVLTTSPTITTPTIATSMTGPILYGGTAAGSMLTLSGTSNGSPSNAYVLLNPSGGGNVGIGSSAPVNTLDVVGSGVHIGSGVPSATAYQLYNSSGTLYWNGSALSTSGMTYPGAGIPQSTGSAWGTSITPGTGVVTALGNATNATGGVVTYSGALGTPTSGTLTNATGLPISTGLTGAGTGVLTALGNATNATGGLVTYSGALGTPTSGTLTNATGLPISTGVSGLGTGVATFLATPSSANLTSAVTGETGSGALVFGTSPTISGATLSNTPTFSQAYTEAVGTLTCGGTQAVSVLTTNLYIVSGCSSATTANVTASIPANSAWIVTFFVTETAAVAFNVQGNSATTYVYWDKNSTAGTGGTGYSGFTLTANHPTVFTCMFVNSSGSSAVAGTSSVPGYCGVAEQY